MSQVGIEEEEVNIKECEEIRKVEYEVPEYDVTDVFLLKCPGGKYTVYLAMYTYEGDLIDYDIDVYDNLRDAVNDYKSQVELIIRDIHLLLADADDGIIELNETARRRLKEEIDIMHKELSEVDELAKGDANARV